MSRFNIKGFSNFNIKKWNFFNTNLPNRNVNLPNRNVGLPNRNVDLPNRNANLPNRNRWWWWCLSKKIMPRNTKYCVRTKSDIKRARNPCNFQLLKKCRKNLKEHAQAGASDPACVRNTVVWFFFSGSGPWWCSFDFLKLTNLRCFWKEAEFLFWMESLIWMEVFLCSFGVPLVFLSFFLFNSS